MPEESSRSEAYWAQWTRASAPADPAVREVRFDLDAQLMAYAQLMEREIAFGPGAPTPMLTTRESDHVREERARRRAERERKVQEARQRAIALLRRFLSDEQWEEWTHHESFTITTPSGSQYRICRGVVQNIYLIEDDVPVEEICCHPQTEVLDDLNRYVGRMPTEDVVVAQYLALMTDEENFRSIANIYPMNGGSRAYRARRAEEEEAARRAHQEARRRMAQYEQPWVTREMAREMLNENILAEATEELRNTQQHGTRLHELIERWLGAD